MIGEAFLEELRPACPAEQRVKLLAGVPGFSLLPPPALEKLAHLMQEASFETGAVVIKQGEVGDHMYLIAHGRAEISLKGAKDEIPLAGIGEGETFGETALLEPGAHHISSVTALTKLRCLTLSDPDFDRLLEEHPDVHVLFAQAAQDMREISFLKRASPFAKLTLERLRWLASKLEPASYGAGASITRTGEAGDACYLITSGRVEVCAEEESGTPRQNISTLGPGAIFGEASLLAGAPRRTNVRAIEPVEVLVLRRSDLLEAMCIERVITTVMIELVHLRARARQAEGVVAYHRTTSHGETVTILKNPALHTYYRLSPEGWFIWQRLDGVHGLRDLTLDYLGQFKAFAPQAIAGILGGLAAAGFAKTASLRTDVLEKVFRLSVWQRAVLGARRITEWQLAVPRIDSHVTRWHRAGIRFIYTRISQLLLAITALFGVAAFVVISRSAGATLHEASGPKLLLFLIPAYLFSILVHEAGHAFTTKAFGYEVPRAGIGWYWFGPIAFVDTSDMWLAGRWPRIAVSLAGPYSNLVLGGLASLLALWTSSAVATAALWQFSLISYLIVLINLNPLLEYDGYYVLMDWLERPNLRPRSLAWMGSELPRVLRTRGGLRGHRLELIYGLASLIYVGLMGVLTLASYRLLVQDWMTRVMSDSLASGLAWVLAGLVVLLSLMSVLGELRSSSHLS